MKFSRLTALAVAISASVTLLASEASAWTGLDNPPYPFWGTIPVQYYVNKQTFPQTIATTAQDRLVAGFASWAQPSCTYFETQLMGDLQGGIADSNDGKNVLYWINPPDAWPNDLGPVDGVIGVTLPIWQPDPQDNLLIFDADIVFNGVGFCWYNHPDAPCGGGSPVDTQSIATHEQGHFLGLGHTDVFGSTMEPAYSGGGDIASIEQDDIDGVCALYPVGGTTVSAAAGGANCSPCSASAANNECIAQTQACTGQCGAVYNCVLACPMADAASYDACTAQCAKNFPDGVAAYTAYSNCICNLCAESCAVQCSGSIGSGPTGAGGSNASGAWNEGGGGSTGPKLSDGGGCGCGVAGNDARIGTLTALAVAFLAFSRRRRSR